MLPLTLYEIEKRREEIIFVARTEQLSGCIDGCLTKRKLVRSI
jgi:hypothetical protein